VIAIPPGLICAAGGQEIEIGILGEDGGFEVQQTAVVCNGANDGGAAAFTIGGVLSGLPAGGSIVLANNGGFDITLTADGPFAFPAPIASGATYAVTIATAPGDQICTVANGGGTVGASNVTNVAVACSPPPPPPSCSGVQCAPGTSCVSVGNNVNQCLQQCRRDVDCSQGICSGGACFLPCDPVGSMGCPPGLVCAIGTSMSNTLATLCVPAGRGVAGSHCTTVLDCAAGYMCIAPQNVCTAVCDQRDPSTCAGGAQCGPVTVGNQVPSTPWGICN
jgi:hypothetical protein